jgi:hypothetical protein
VKQSNFRFRRKIGLLNEFHDTRHDFVKVWKIFLCSALPSVDSVIELGTCGNANDLIVDGILGVEKELKKFKIDGTTPFGVFNGRPLANEDCNTSAENLELRIGDLNFRNKMICQKSFEVEKWIEKGSRDSNCSVDSFFLKKRLKVVRCQS